MRHFGLDSCEQLDGNVCHHHPKTCAFAQSEPGCDAIGVGTVQMGQSIVHRNTDVAEADVPFSPFQQLVGVGKSFELRLADFGLSDRTGEDSGEKET